MKEKVFRIGCTWEYIQDLDEIKREHYTESEVFDDVIYLPITDRVKAQVCILRKEDRYGIYTLDHTNGMGGPGTWCNPMAIPCGTAAMRVSAASEYCMTAVFLAVHLSAPRSLSKGISAKESCGISGKTKMHLNGDVT